MAAIDINTGQLSKFFQKLGQAGSDTLKEEITTWLTSLGERFLKEVHTEILNRDVVDTRRLLGSFVKGGAGNVFEIAGDGLSIEVGTNVEYARWVEEGYQQTQRFVPGSWDGAHFRYGEGSGGMMLKEQWIPGRFYFEGGKRVFESVLPYEVATKMRTWFHQYFGG